eukprot:4697259-Prymnesium_polylepis.1
MSTSDVERRVNHFRGLSCLFITAASVLVVLADPRCFVFWVDNPAVFELTGWPGLLLSLSFAIYLAGDTLISFVWRRHFRRSLGAVRLLRLERQALHAALR